MQETQPIISTILDALPYIKKFHNKIIVIKYGGSAQIEEKLQDTFAKDIVLLSLIGVKVVIVHGGGAKISSYLDKLNIKSKFVDGHRVTSKEALEVAEMVLSGNINKSIVSMLNHHGARAIGISGKDLSSFSATSKSKKDDDFTGIIKNVNAKVIKKLLKEKFIPVIAPIGNSDENMHNGFNINADLVASSIAGALGAKKVLFLTDTKGVLDKDKNLLSTLNTQQIQQLKDDSTIYGGMIPKVDSCLDAINKGVKEAHIIDGRIEHSILLELLTKEGIGTIIS
jgi:acetylglutamate kinase